jgi:hypothetical protein
VIDQSQPGSSSLEAELARDFLDQLRAFNVLLDRDSLR